MTGKSNTQPKERGGGMDNVVLMAVDNTVVIRAVLSSGQFSYLVGVMLAALWAVAWSAHL